MNILDGKQMKDRNSAHEYLKKELNFPDYYGKNLDALYDLLTEIGEDTTIRIENSQSVRDSLGEYGDNLIGIFEDAAKENSSLQVEVK